MLIRSVGVIMAMLRQHLAGRGREHFVLINFYGTRNLCTLKNTFKDIPSPQRAWPLIGHSHLFGPMGPYKAERLTEAVMDLSRQLGPVFKMKLNGADIVVTVDADDTRTMFRHEGRHPFRPPFPAVEYYRQKTYGSIGIVPGNGQEWYKFRAAILPLLRMHIVKAYADQHVQVANSFVDYIQMKMDETSSVTVTDICQHLMKFNIEAMSVMSPGVRLVSLATSSSREQVAEDLMNASNDLMEGFYRTLTRFPLWKFCRTRGYRKLEASHEVFYRVLEDRLQEMKHRFKESPEETAAAHPFLASLFDNPTLEWKDIVMLAMEIFAGGIEAVSEVTFTRIHTERSFITSLQRETGNICL